MKYIIKGHKTAADVANNVETILGERDNLESAQRLAIAHQRGGSRALRYIAAWVEPIKRAGR